MSAPAAKKAKLDWVAECRAKNEATREDVDAVLVRVRLYTSELTSSRVLIGDVIFNIQERGTQGVQPASVVHFCQALCCRPHYGLPAAVVCVKEIEQR